MNNANPDLDAIRLMLRDGQFGAAAGYCAEVLQRQPELWEAYYLLGCACRRTGDWNNAQMALRGLLQHQPDHLPALRELALVLELMDELEAAVQVFGRLLAIDPGDVPSRLKMGEILAALGRSEAALASYGAVLAAQPDNIPALIGAGHAARALGRKREAVESYRSAARVDPGCGAAWHSLANMKDYAFTDEELAAMERALAAGSGQDAAALSTLFALGMAYDERREFDKAWSYYQRGNRLGEKLRPWDRAAFAAQVDALIDAFPRDRFAVTAPAVPGAGTPIFIVGLPRSGSTLVEQILASHSQVEGTRELPALLQITRSLRSRTDPRKRYPELVAELGPADLGLLAQDYLANCASQLQSERPCFTDKMPNNFLHIGLIHLLFPRAGIVHVHRGALDTCVANLRHHFAREQNFAYGEANVAHYYRQYRRLMAHWHSVLPGRIVDVSYESLVAHPQDEIPALLGALGLAFEQGCLAFHQNRREVHTASSEQVRQPVYTSAIGFWRHYERHLDELRASLAGLE